MLALIAGGGDLPRRVAAAQSEAPLVCALEGNRRPDGLDVDVWFRLEMLGSLLLQLGNAGVSEVCMCGGIDRPKLDPGALDDETKPLVPLFLKAMQQGDDGALRAAMSIFEQTGFAVRGAHELAPDLLPPAGELTRRTPRSGHRTDAEAATAVLADMGAADLGQACVIRKGRVIAQEDEAGTDAMLESLAAAGAATRRLDGEPLHWLFDGAGNITRAGRDWIAATSQDSHEAPGAGAILFKAPKPGQDRRADLPVIGLGTAMRAAEAGMDGIVIEAGGVMVLDRDAVIAVLDAMDMFLWVRS